MRTRLSSKYDFTHESGGPPARRGQRWVQRRGQRGGMVANSSAKVWEQIQGAARVSGESPPVIGVGSGDLVANFLHQCSTSEPESMKDLAFQPIGTESIKQELSLLGLGIHDGARAAGIIVVQADQVDDSRDDGEIWFIAGRGFNGPQTSLVDLQALKDAVASCSRAIILTSEEAGPRLGGRLPVVIEGDEVEWEEIAEEIDDLFVTDAEITRRSHCEDANTRGMPDPVIFEARDGTPTMILDLAFYEGLQLMGDEASYAAVQRELESTPGVVATGLVGVEQGRAIVVRWREGDAKM